jgi:hypothetical protein
MRINEIVLVQLVKGEKEKRRPWLIYTLRKNLVDFWCPVLVMSTAMPQKWREAVSVPSDAKRKKCRHCLGVSLEKSCTQFEGMVGYCEGSVV